MGNQPVARPLYLHKGQHKQNIHTQTCMLRVRFESTIPVLQRAKTVHASDREVTAECIILNEKCATYFTNHLVADLILCFVKMKEGLSDILALCMFYLHPFLQFLGRGSVNTLS
jgi:hypothetical protein